MNAIQLSNAIDLYTNLTQSGRFYFTEKNKAVNDAILKKIDSITDGDNPNRLSGISRLQKFRDELYTLIDSATLTVTNVSTINDIIKEDQATLPNNYQTFAGLRISIAGNTTYGRDTTYGQLGPMLDCSFRKPNNKKPYFLENKTGLLIYRGEASTISNATLFYVKIPATFNMGTESQLINPGAAVLALPVTTYIAVEVSVYNGITYKEGDEFSTTGALQVLTSGQVILKSLTTTCDLPQKTHAEIAKMAAEILLGVIEKYENSAFTEKQTS